MKIDFLDDLNEIAIGKTSESGKCQHQYSECIVTIGDSKRRQYFMQQIVICAILEHPDTIVFGDVEIGEGCVIEANSVVNTRAKIGRGTFICDGAIINHDAIVGDYCQIDCNTVVASGVIVYSSIKFTACTVWDGKKH